MSQPEIDPAPSLPPPALRVRPGGPGRKSPFLLAKPAARHPRLRLRRRHAQRGPRTVGDGGRPTAAGAGAGRVPAPRGAGARAGPGGCSGSWWRSRGGCGSAHSVFCRGCGRRSRTRWGGRHALYLFMRLPWGHRHLRRLPRLALRGLAGAAVRREGPRQRRPGSGAGAAAALRGAGAADRRAGVRPGGRWWTPPPPTCGVSSGTCTTGPRPGWSPLAMDLGMAKEKLLGGPSR